MAKQLRGDINNDGKLSIIDMLTIFLFKSGEIPKNLFDSDELQRADADGDKYVTLADVLVIQQHIEGKALIDGVIE